MRAAGAQASDNQMIGAAWVGVGLKSVHYADALDAVGDATSRPGWFEVHPQNYMVAGGPPHRWLGAIREAYELSLHSVGLSLGSAEGVDSEELERLATLVERYEPALVSDHLSWSVSGADRFPDLLPLPSTRLVLEHLVCQVHRVQERIGRPILVENPSRYLAFGFDEMSEPELLAELCARTSCGVLLDINNIVVTANNLGGDAIHMLDDYAKLAEVIGEVHLAGHSIEEHASGPLCVDDHGSRVAEVCWSLYERFVNTHGPRPTLIEWDTRVPSFDVLVGEAHAAERIVRSAQEQVCREHAA